MSNIIFFFFIQLINVIFSTIKSIVTIKSKPFIAGIVNAFYFSLYYYIIKLVTNENLMVVLIISFITNLIGVIIGKELLDYFEKDKLWVYTAFIKCNETEADLLKYNFETNGCYCVYDSIKYNKFYSFKIFANKKEKSIFINSQLKDNLDAKYYITESR